MISAPFLGERPIIEMTQGLSQPRLIPPQCLCPHIRFASDIVYPISVNKVFGPRRLIQSAAERPPIRASIPTTPNDTSKPKNWETYPLANPRIDAPIV